METVGSGLLVFETVKGVSSFSPELCSWVGLVSDGEYALNFLNFHPRPGRGLSKTKRASTAIYSRFALFVC